MQAAVRRVRAVPEGRLRQEKRQEALHERQVQAQGEWHCLQRWRVVPGRRLCRRGRTFLPPETFMQQPGRRRVPDERPGLLLRYDREWRPLLCNLREPQKCGRL